MAQILDRIKSPTDLRALGREELHQLVADITAAMPDGTSTDVFSRSHSEWYFDVGIAEAHGVTFAAGLATEAMRPVVAIYSTFLQRAYNSILHDVALQDLPVIFCMDRAGIAREDGPAHHGVFDICYMLCVPGMTVTVPKDGIEMLGLLRTAVGHTAGPFSIRRPRAAVPSEVPAITEIDAVPYGSWELLREGEQLAILAVGTMVRTALVATDALAEDGIRATVVNCRFLKRPSTVRFESVGIADRFVEHGARAELLAELGLDAAGIRARWCRLVEHAPQRPVARESA
ncbi:MAG: hypothetical protein OXI46_00305 [Gemmatimonadota bacterium]|nr:hypothetical protein [Gemmatimonadota bacterium]